MKNVSISMVLHPIAKLFDVVCHFLVNLLYVDEL
jgi:hypothetical protein